MNKAMIVFLGTFLIGFSNIYAAGEGEKIGSSGNKTISERIVSPFNKIETTDVYSKQNSEDTKGILRIHSSQEYRVSINIDSNLEQYIQLVNANNILKIEIKRRMTEEYILDIYCPNIIGIAINNTAQVEFVDKMITPSLEITINGAGRITGAIECDSFLVNAAGAGAIEISGASYEARVNIGGAGIFDGYELRINNGTFRITGVGSIECWVIDNMTATISGVGSIKYRGEPNIHSSRSGIGSIKKARKNLL
jgi:hypothetical protein